MLKVLIESFGAGFFFTAEALRMRRELTCSLRLRLYKLDRIKIGSRDESIFPSRTVQVISLRSLMLGQAAQALAGDVQAFDF